MTRAEVQISGTEFATHTMGTALRRYVLPKVPDWVLEDGRPVQVVAATSFLELAASKGNKLFNWRRPSFALAGGAVRCLVTPGTAYALHYGHLLATAATMRAKAVQVTAMLPAVEVARSFLRTSLPPLPRADAIVLGYVERLQLGNTEEIPWVRSPGWAWKLARVGGKSVVMLGCEFSFWGDIAGHLLAELFDRQATDWVLYVGKVGSMRTEVPPNRILASGTESLVDDHPVIWRGRLADTLPRDESVFLDARHVTVDSVIEETITWFERYSPTRDLVDPEIGHMGAAARDANMTFDYLHLVTDCLAKDYGFGLYDERSREVAHHRMLLVKKAGHMLEYAIMRT